MDLWTMIEVTLTVMVLVTSIWKAARATLRLARSKALYPMLLQLITDAEATGKSGPEKLNYVLSRIKAFAKSRGIKADLIYIRDLIEKIILTTKRVNING